jgi:hypothetical protein
LLDGVFNGEFVVDLDVFALGELVLELENVGNEENEEELDDELENVGNEENEEELDDTLDDELDAEGVDVIIFKSQQNIISVSY